MTAITTTADRLLETSSGFDRIDREAGIIRGVRVLGLTSKNGRRYLREAVQKAKGLYEGARVYLDHKFKGDRSTKERWGKLVNVREASDGGLIADLEYLTKHSETEAILEAAEKFLDIGLSHDTLGRSRIEGGERVIYEIVKVNSVDLVENPATTENLWESEMPKVKKNVLRVLRENRAKSKVADRFLKRIAEMSDDNDPMLSEMGIDDLEMEVEADAPLEGDSAVKAALRQAILAVLDGPDDSAATIKKIKMLMDAGDKVMLPPAVAPAVEEDDEEDDMVLPESVRRMSGKFDKLFESLARKMEKKLEAVDASLASVREIERIAEARIVEGQCRELLESSNREVTEERLRLLAGASEGDREALVESWAPVRQRPGVSRPKFTESVSPVGSYAEVRKSIPALNK